MRERIRELFPRARSGDLAAFGALIGLTEPIVRGIVKRWRRPGLDELELATLVYTEAWKGLRSIRSAEAFVPWLTRVAVRVAAREARRNQRFEPTVEQEHLEGLPDPEQDDIAWIHDLVGELPDECRGLIDMKYLREMSLEEISDRTGLRIHRIEYLLRKGRDLLRRRIQRRDPPPQSSFDP